jgi:predicted amidohydrolase
MLARYVELRRQEADIVVFPGMSAPEGWQVDLAVLEAAMREHGGIMAFGTSTDGCAAARSTTVVTAEGAREHIATHGRGITPGELPAPIIATPAGNLGVLCGDEALVPEVARSLALEGAEFIAWTVFEPQAMDEALARTRADENRVYVAAAWAGGGIVAAPNGAVVAASPDGSGVAMAASVNRSIARWKDMAPGTNVIDDRIPAAYGALTK